MNIFTLGILGMLAVGLVALFIRARLWLATLAAAAVPLALGVSSDGAVPSQWEVLPHGIAIQRRRLR